MKHPRKFKRTHFSFIDRPKVDECEFKVFDICRKRNANQLTRFDRQGWPTIRQDNAGNVSRFYNTHKPNGITLVLEIKNHTESATSMYRNGILIEQHFNDVSIYYHRDGIGTGCVQVVPSEIKYGRKRGCHV